MEGKLNMKMANRGTHGFPKCSARGFPFQGQGPGVKEVTKRVAFVFASVRKRSRVLRVPRSLGSRKSPLDAEQSSLFTLSLPKVPAVTGIGMVLVAKRRTVVTFGLVFLS